MKEIIAYENANKTGEGYPEPKNEPVLINMGSKYLKYVGISYLLSAVSQVYLTFMKKCNAVKWSTAISSVAVVLNIILNAVLIFGLFGVPVRIYFENSCIGSEFCTEFG